MRTGLPAAGAHAGTNLRLRGDDVLAGRQAVDAVDAAIVRYPVPSRRRRRSDSAARPCADEARARAVTAMPCAGWPSMSVTVPVITAPRGRRISTRSGLPRRPLPRPFPDVHCASRRSSSATIAFLGAGDREATCRHAIEPERSVVRRDRGARRRQRGAADRHARATQRSRLRIGRITTTPTIAPVAAAGVHRPGIALRHLCLNREPSANPSRRSPPHLPHLQIHRLVLPLEDRDLGRDAREHFEHAGSRQSAASSSRTATT